MACSTRGLTMVEVAEMLKHIVEEQVVHNVGVLASMRD